METNAESEIGRIETINFDFSQSGRISPFHSVLQIFYK